MSLLTPHHTPAQQAAATPSAEACEAVGRGQLKVGKGGEDRLIAEISQPTLPARAA